VDWQQSATVIWNRLRAFTPWPGAFTFLPGADGPQLLKIWKVEVLAAAGAPGEILAADKSGLVVGCGAGAIRILELQREGGRRQSAEQFLAGAPLRAGMRLGWNNFGLKMKLTIDRKADALYLDLDDASVVESEEVSPGVIFDYNASGKVVGIEMLYLSQRVSPEEIGRMQMETVGAWYRFYSETIVPLPGLGRLTHIWQKETKITTEQALFSWFASV